ncbi:hypothetical protein SAMN04488057_102488 [Cyclobacterium lianum]|uniref:DUF4347 domain-containing protein n=1 Tax=Cyclobacterium lianum TaxID=388280 RepID=A0A1M7KIN9_9BACT|nr:hypothetical protein [Cyclobacterium lianum]SHM65186.1 hypothetical protein SAMN04488057_102488 [Cyclobacterium lianum]
MATELNVIAPYTKGWDSQNQYGRTEARIVRNAPNSWEVILGYDDLPDLINKINQLLTIDPDHPCLKTLEIYAHGNPVAINDLSRSDVNSWASQLKTLSWCDEASIYLSGCNTGLMRTTRITNPLVTGPIAKLLADALQFNATSFAHRIWVYGSKGYLSGSHVEGSEKTVDTFTERELALSIPPWTTTIWEKFPGGSNATGNACWIGFKNGNW